MGQNDAKGLGCFVTCASDEKFALAFEALQAKGLTMLNPVLRAWLSLLSVSHILAAPETPGDPFFTGG